MTFPAAARIGAVLGTLGCLLTGVVPGAAGMPAAPAEGDVVLDVTAIGPGVLRPDGTLTVRATVRNAGTAPVVGASVRLLGYSVRLADREDVRDWAAGESGVIAGNRFLVDTPLAPVPPGGAVPVELSAAAATFRLPGEASSWGPRGLTVDVFDATEGAQLAVARGFAVWDPRPAADGSPDRTTVSLLAPLSAGPPDVADAVVPAERMAELTAGGGRLARVLQVASRPDVAWALDPALLSSAAAAAAGPPADTGTPGGATTAGPTPTPPDGTRAAVTAWLDALRGAAAGRDVLALPQADPDVAAVAHAGTAELYRLASRQGRETVGQLLDAPARTDVAWPATGAADTASLQLAADAGATLVVLTSGAQPPARPGAVTPTGRSTVTAGTARLDGLLVDTALSTALTAATEARTGTRGTSSALSTSLLLADTAVITREDPDAGAHLLLALPRTWSPDVRAATAALDALGSAPWVGVAPLDQLVDADPDPVQRQPVRRGSASAGELPADGVRQALAAVRTVRSVASALTDADSLLDEVEYSAVAATSAGWRGNTSTWREQVAALAGHARGVPASVHVLPGSAVNVVSSTADLPVSVANDLDQEVLAAVRVRPRNPRLVVPGDVEVRLPASSTQRVAVPVRSVANGNTDVVVTVRAPDGTMLGEPVTIPVRVRADWETRGMLLAGAVLSVVLVVGLFRTIRRGRRREELSDPLRDREPEVMR
jgi:hypothetical protein